MSTRTEFCYCSQMPFGRALNLAVIFAGVLAAVLLANTMAYADDTAPRPPASVPVKNAVPRAVSPHTTELPPSALGMDEDKSRLGAPSEDKSDVKIPDHIKFGDNTLHFDAKRRETVPPTGMEANEEHVINKAAPDDSPLPRYFGLRLTTPFSTPGR